jgi:Zn-dependent metalloprotease
MKPLLLVVFAVFAINLNAQIGYEVTKKSTNGTPAYIKFRSESGVNHFNFLEKMNGEFGFRTDDELYLTKQESDKLGYTHYRYKQKYKGLIVDGAEFIIHEKDSIAVTANGFLIPNINVDTIAKISKDDAIKSAMKSLGLSKYRWEDKKAEEQLKKKTHNPVASYYPNPVLVIYTKKGKSILCYKFDIAGATMDKAWTVCINAENGELVGKRTLVHHDTPSVAQTYYNGARYITSTYNADYNMYLLYETQRGNNANQQIYTFTANSETLPNVWDSIQYLGSYTTTFDYDLVANSVHWGMEMAYDFYQLLGRHSFDDNNTYILNLVHYGDNLNNAFWSTYDTIMCYGDGDGIEFDYFTSLDISGHEFTHAITSYSANLQYEGESGALNESFSDIFGTGIEFFVSGTNNWTIGEDIMLSEPNLRSMSNPHNSLDPQPSTYGENDPYWINPDCIPDQSNDYCGVHTNSGVQNFWFYLLAHGGSGTNANGDFYAVSGIGMSDALNVAYRNLTVYLTSNSDYSDAAAGSIQSAIDYWGNNSQQLISVKKAWCAVGVLDCNVTDVNTSPVLLTSIYPNPTSGRVSISGSFKIEKIKVIDNMGKEIRTYTYGTGNNFEELDLSDITNGMYFLQIICGNSTVTKKIVLNRN